jgi:hypothetical protein
MFDCHHSDLGAIDRVVREFIVSDDAYRMAFSPTSRTRPETYHMKRRCEQAGILLRCCGFGDSSFIMFRPQGWFPGYTLTRFDETDTQICCGTCDRVVEKSRAYLSMGVCAAVCVDCAHEHEVIAAHKCESLDDDDDDDDLSDT